VCLLLPPLMGGPPSASYTPSACSSKPGFPQIRFDIVRWRPLETSKPPPSGLLDEYIADSVPLSILVVARELSSLPRPRVSIPLTDCSWEKVPLEPRMLGQACFLTSPHKFCEV
jgi:hypothetical protein